ncbi:MAG: hypothetical protein EAX96_14235 [Candidatus Lokiarchaeota archaeon]|nr:hypothetical protein [Candidatus Lokiarchaeota archaeon]
MFKAFIVNDRQVKNVLSDANNIYEEANIIPSIKEECLKVLFKYVEKKVFKHFPTEIREISAAINYIIERNPHSYPNEMSREFIARRFDIKVSSLDWHIKNLIEELNITKIQDKAGNPYFFEDLSLINSIIISQCNEILGTHIIFSILDDKILDIDIIKEEICDLILNRLKLIPKTFQFSLQYIIVSLIQPIIDKIMEGK